VQKKSSGGTILLPLPSRSPAAKRYLVNLRLKMTVSSSDHIQELFTRWNIKLGDWLAKWYCGNTLHFHAGLPKKLSV